MKQIRTIVTGSGAPGIKGTLYSLYNNYDNRDIYVVGTDIRDNVVGKYLCDSFYTIPKPTEKEEYINYLISICKKEEIDVIIPQNTAELNILSKNKKLFLDNSVKIVVSEHEPILNSNNKYYLLNQCKDKNIPYPKYFLVNDSNALYESAKKIGWPNSRIVIKPPCSNGMRGFRIIDESIDKRDMFFNEKPIGTMCTIQELIGILGDNFPDLLVTEYLPGEEYTVDLFRYKDIMKIIPRRRELIRSGITFNGITENHESIINYSKILAENLKLEFCFGFQFKLDNNNDPKILECNPRVQGTMVLSTIAGANIIYSSVKAVLGENIPEMNIRWNTRLLRYWGGVGVVDGIHGAML